jgi:ATP-binding cassette subfamily F protein 2
MGRNDKKKAAKKTTTTVAEPSQPVAGSRMDDLELPYMASGLLESLPMSRDVKIGKFSVQIGGRPLIADTTLELNWGARYGLIGTNGCGKSIMLQCLGNRLVPIPTHMDVYLLDQEVAASDLTAIEAIMSELAADVARLEAEAEVLADAATAESEERLQDIYEQLAEMDPEIAKARAAKILHGLGFTKEMQLKKCKDYSGGWRMRIALAKALWIKPAILLLDEPTNHLDLEACVWLEDYLKNYNRILLLISHSQDFLNNVCTDVIHICIGQLMNYRGNYDQYIKTRAEKEENQMKRFHWEQEQIKHMKEYIGRFGSGNAKMASQAKSKEKVLFRMEEKGLTEAVVNDKNLSFAFACVGTLPPPVLAFHEVAFGYTPDKLLYKGLDFGVDLDSRIALVGPNGVGKSTLLKLMVGTNIPVLGQVKAHQHLKIGYFHQHLNDQLDETLTPLEYMMKTFDEDPQTMRRMIGRFGVTGKDQTTPIKILSDGIKTRVVLAAIAYREPHMLLLDEPTNHLDMESIDALAEAINDFDGGLILVSHDFRLISQVAQELWICTPKGIQKFKGDITEYKQTLVDNMRAEMEKDE